MRPAFVLDPLLDGIAPLMSCQNGDQGRGNESYGCLPMTGFAFEQRYPFVSIPTTHYPCQHELGGLAFRRLKSLFPAQLDEVLFTSRLGREPFHEAKKIQHPQLS
jgi:hypothetical protein